MQGLYLKRQRDKLVAADAYNIYPNNYHPFNSKTLECRIAPPTEMFHMAIIQKNTDEKVFLDIGYHKKDKIRFIALSVY